MDPASGGGMAGLLLGGKLKSFPSGREVNLLDSDAIGPDRRMLLLVVVVLKVVMLAAEVVLGILLKLPLLPLELLLLLLMLALL